MASNGKVDAFVFDCVCHVFNFDKANALGPPDELFDEQATRTLRHTQFGGADFGEAIARAYADVAKITFDGMQFRHDIGRKALKFETS